MKELEVEKLCDSNQFECLGRDDPGPGVHDALLNLWRSGESSGFVSRHVSYNVVGICDSGRPSTLSVFKPGIPYYYGLLKIHKLKDCDILPGHPVPLRLVNDLSQSATARSDKFINWKYLLPLQKDFCKDLVKDSTDALKWLEKYDGKDQTLSSISGFSWDFSALYDNLTPDLVKEALVFSISELRPDWSDDFVGWILDLVDLSLGSCFGKHGDLWFRNKGGIATGGSLSVSLANITVYYVLRCVIYDSGNVPKGLLGLKRFVDDLAGLWVGSKNDFITWANMVNESLNRFGLSIKDNLDDPWDFNSPGNYTVFLDIRFMFNSTGCLFTDVNVKSTDAGFYLHYSSYHPRNTFPSIVYSQALRYRRIINDDLRLHRRLEELEQCFLKSGYPKKLVKNILIDVVKRKRNLDYTKKEASPPNKVLWVQTFGPATAPIKKLVKDANKLLQSSQAWADNKTVMGVVCKRAKNIGDMILKRKHLALSSHNNSEGTERCTSLPLPNQKRKRGRPCASCPLMSNSSTITSTATGKIFKTPRADCKSRNLIYCAQCRICNKQYAGKSVNKLQKRISGHRSHVGDEVFDEDSDEATLAEHLQVCHNLTTVDHFNNNYSFTVLENSPKDLDNSEQRWVSRLLTMRPFGLNKEKPGGVTDSVSSMCRRSIGHLHALF